MKENKYDDNIFFQKYSQMSRSQQGLAGAGEWETLRKLLPDFKDKRVLDLGCGYGWHCIYAMEHGASSVVGVDISHKMLEVAKEKTHFPQVEYKCCAIEDVEFPEESFDVILSSLAFHYVADYEILVKKIYRILKSGGKLVFTVEHPVFTAYGTQDWHYNEKGEILHFPVDNYYYEGKRTAVFLGEKVTKYHRTLTTYLNTLLSNGFIITSNPQPIGFSGILLAKRQNSFYCTYFLHNRNVADTKSPYPIKRLEVIRWFNQKSMVFNQSPCLRRKKNTSSCRP